LKCQIDDIYDLVDMEDEDVKSAIYRWDGGDCSLIGIIEILLLQEIKKHKESEGGWYNKEYDEIKLRYKF
jgi:hypothetical protein